MERKEETVMTEGKFNKVLLDYDGNSHDDFGLAPASRITPQANTLYTFSGTATVNLTSNDTYADFNVGTFAFEVRGNGIDSFNFSDL